MIHTLKERNLNKIIKIDSDSDVFDILKNEDIIKIEKDRKNSAINYCKITKDFIYSDMYHYYGYDMSYMVIRQGGKYCCEKNGIRSFFLKN